VGLFSKASKQAPLPADAKTAKLNIAVLLSDMVLLDVGVFKRYYKAVCGSRASVTEIPLEKKDVGEFQRLDLESEGRKLVLSLRSGPLPQQLVSMMGQMTELSVLGSDMAEDEVNALKNHQAHAVVGGLTFEDHNDPQRPINQAWLAAETLLTLFEHRKEFIGYAPVAAQVYRPRRWLVARTTETKIAQADLFMLLGNLQFHTGELNWMHTLGMEQFGQPDLEVWFADRDKGNIYFELLGNAAMYSISKSLLMLGNTFELEGMPEKYKLVAPKEVKNHQWGKFGALGLEPVTKS
jgi:hypothetical protein